VVDPKSRMTSRSKPEAAEGGPRVNVGSCMWDLVVVFSLTHQQVISSASGVGGMPWCISSVRPDQARWQRKKKKRGSSFTEVVGKPTWSTPSLLAHSPTTNHPALWRPL
jgi:hypothetical protein